MDPDANVREAAILSLAKSRGHDADAIYVKALEKPDDQVVIAAAGALKGTAQKDAAAGALLRALAAISVRHRDTSRDARAAILERVREVAGAASIDALRPYLSDFDPKIAALAADVLTRLTGQPQTATTTRIRTLPLPPSADLRTLPSLMRVTMAGGRRFDITLFVDESPITIWRVVRLANAGYYNGLTFHRIVANLRGTIGVSTRGRDTGDAQIYLNTVDSPRLDHVYPVFGQVISGMDVVDGILEGDVIETIEFPVAPPSKPPAK